VINHKPASCWGHFNPAPPSVIFFWRVGSLGKGTFSPVLFSAAADPWLGLDPLLCSKTSPSGASSFSRGHLDPLRPAHPPGCRPAEQSRRGQGPRRRTYYPCMHDLWRTPLGTEQVHVSFRHGGTRSFGPPHLQHAYHISPRTPVTDPAQPADYIQATTLPFL